MGMHQPSLAQAMISSKTRSVNDVKVVALAACDQAQLPPKSLLRTRRKPSVALAVADKPVPPVPVSHNGSLGDVDLRAPFWDLKLVPAGIHPVP